MMSRYRVLFVAMLIVAFAVSLAILSAPRRPVIGFTYSTIYAEHLGLHPTEGFSKIVDEMPFEFVRIPAYWNRYEPLNNIWQFEELRSLLDTADQNDVDVILAIGQKVPRWPECFVPDWANELEESAYREEFLEFTNRIVEEFAQHPALARWQVENESYFPFGDCTTIKPELIRAQANIVREHGAGKPIQTTVSGEQGVGFSKAPFADIIGFSLYRSVSVPGVGRYTFPHTPFFYRVQSWLVNLSLKQSVISELQTEPWGLHEFDLNTSVGLSAGYEAFTVEDLEKQIRFARKTGMREMSVWGVEWWLILAQRGESRLWEGARGVLRDL